MIYENVELHNCAELYHGDGFVGMQRVPETIREKLNSGAQQRMRQPAGAELRFHLPPESSARLTLSSEETSQAVIYFGDFRHSALIALDSTPQTIDVEWHPTLLSLHEEMRRYPHTFDPTIVRVRMMGSAVRIHDIHGDEVRPPRADELPQRRYMAYGTSITHGASALAPHLTYVGITARLLGSDLLNFGVGGACHCEGELADYLAAREDWDFATLALSVNMVGGFECDEFDRRVRYMINTIAGSNPQRPVNCITLYPYRGDLRPAMRDKAQRFRRILEDAVKDCSSKNVAVLKGPDLLRNYTGLTSDILHPSDDGMIEMGTNLAQQLKPQLDLSPAMFT